MSIEASKIGNWDNRIQQVFPNIGNKYEATVYFGRESIPVDCPDTWEAIANRSCEASYIEVRDWRNDIRIASACYRYDCDMGDSWEIIPDNLEYGECYDIHKQATPQADGIDIHPVTISRVLFELAEIALKSEIRDVTNRAGGLIDDCLQNGDNECSGLLHDLSRAILALSLT